MNKFSLLSLIAVVLLILGAFFAPIVGLEINDGLAIVGFVAVATLGIIGVVKKSEAKKDWKFWLVVGAFLVGTLLGIVGGLTESTMTALIGAVVVISGIILPLILNKIKPKD